MDVWFEKLSLNLFEKFITAFCAAALYCAFTIVASVADAKESSRQLLVDGGKIIVREVIDGDTIRLQKPVFGVRQIRLVGIQAPKLPLGRKGFKAWPLSKESKKALEKLIRRKRLHIRFGGRRQDRHRRLLAHIYDQDNNWVQGEMLRLGMARVYSFPDNRSRVAAMLKIERAARQAKRGIWGHPFYDIRTPEEAAGHIGTFQLVRGRIVNTAKVRTRVYLNFGKNWRNDFTITLRPRARRYFRKARIDPLALKGKTVLVRGWLRKRNGPMIDVSHPEQIELIKENK
jgi:micrococcal nuclease